MVVLLSRLKIVHLITANINTVILLAVSWGGGNRLNHAYAMALTSIASGMDMGIVIDKAKNGDGGLCHAYGMTADLRAK